MKERTESPAVAKYSTNRNVLVSCIAEQINRLKFLVVKTGVGGIDLDEEINKEKEGSMGTP